MQIQPDTVKDELRLFIGNSNFREVDDYLPNQRGKAISELNFELKEHQKQALIALENMRKNHETIALICHATGTGKTGSTPKIVENAKKVWYNMWEGAD